MSITLHVAYVLGYLAARYGGPPRSARQLGQSLSSFGVRSEWWATATTEEQAEFAGCEQGIHLFSPTFPHSWYRSPAFRRALAGEIGRYDLLHLYQVWDYPLWAAAGLARQRGLPYLVSPSGIFSQPWRYRGPKKGAYLRLLARPFLNRAGCLHALVPEDVTAYRAAGLSAPCTVIPNGVNLARFSALPPASEADLAWPQLAGRPVVLYCGRLSEEKGLIALAQAWALLRQKVPQALLVLAGADYQGHRAQLEAELRRLNLAPDSVWLSGLVTGDAHLRLLARADVYVQPSISEGFSRALLEALAASRPCIITPGCRFPGIAQADAGRVVESTDQSLAEALLELLSLSSAERAEMGGRGHALAEADYSDEKMARRMLAVYRCLCAGAPIPLHPTPAEP